MRFGVLNHAIWSKPEQILNKNQINSNHCIKRTIHPKKKKSKNKHQIQNFDQMPINAWMNREKKTLTFPPKESRSMSMETELLDSPILDPIKASLSRSDNRMKSPHPLSLSLSVLLLGSIFGRKALRWFIYCLLTQGLTRVKATDAQRNRRWPVRVTGVRGNWQPYADWRRWPHWLRGIAWEFLWQMT